MQGSKLGRLSIVSPLAWIYVVCLCISHAAAEEIIIQEDAVGFCSVDGSVMTSVEGYTGTGYADTDIGLGYSVSWSVFAAEAGTGALVWNYGNGGNLSERPGRLVINGATARDSVIFPHTSKWTNWRDLDTVWVELDAGYNSIRLEALESSGLVNIDYLKVIGPGVMPVECVPSYVLSVGQNDERGGTVSYEPVLDYYDEGTLVTVTAQAQPGYFFQSWSGEVPGAEAVHTFAIGKSTSAVAIFLPEGTRADPDLVGYASVQDDRGTPYLVTGGSLGDTVEAHSVDELKAYLGRDEPIVVTFSGQFVGATEIDVRSHKTLLGMGPQAHLKGIGLQINEARNVIVRNVQISHVTPQDAIEINNRSKNIWIDHCELYSDLEHGKDYYDGLLDIKNESAFITISWTHFHDHFKTSLISSGDQAVADSVIRVTYHHNLFQNCSSRLPSIRFGTAHIFNNYYLNSDTAINSRMGACTRIENNYFEGVRKSVQMDFTPVLGNVQLIGNHFGESEYVDSPLCELVVPYPYAHALHEAEELPALIGGQWATAIEEHDAVPKAFSLANYPNPFNAGTQIRFALPAAERVTLEVFDVVGRKVATLLERQPMAAGVHEVAWSADGRATGVYFYRIQAAENVRTRKMILVK